MFKGYKTYITAAVAVITALAAYFTGEATMAQTGQLVFSALFATFIRNGMSA